jgi:hypothetical protein
MLVGCQTPLSLLFGAGDYFGDKSWQDDQTRLLEQIRDRLPNP